VKILDKDSNTAIEYFFCRSIPVLEQCKPSSLWHFVLQLFHQQKAGSVARSIACAIGQQQRTIEEATSGSSKEDSKGNILYNAALSHMRRDIAITASDPTSHATVCLLLVILESLHGSCSNILLHLQHYVCIARAQKALRQQDDAILRQAVVFLEIFLVTTMNSELYSEEAALARRLIDELRDLVPAIDDVAALERKFRTGLLKIFSQIFADSQSGRFVAANVDSESDFAADFVYSDFAVCESAMESAVKAAIEEEGPRSKAYYHAVQARSLLTLVALRQMYDPTHDSAQDLEQYNRIIDLEELALGYFHQSPIRDVSSNASFSLGLASISTLCHVAIRCKDFYVRRRAYLVLEACPQREGVWTVEQARKLCQGVFKLEEQKVLHIHGMQSCQIPEDCQIRVASIIKDDGNTKLRVHWSAGPGTELSPCQDVTID
jgi:hypothetical protein